MLQQKVEVALKLLTLAEGEISLREAMEIIKSVSRLNEVAKLVLDLGESRGLIKRKRGRIKVITQAEKNWRVERRNCEATCSRCGRRIKNCYYVVFPEGEVGPFGSECINFIRR